MNPDGNGESNSQLETSRLPSLSALRCFEAAADAESFSRAADRLHLTHGAISRAVRQLEEELGVLLFERRSRRVFLTEAGKKLAQAVRDGFGMIETATRELREIGRNRPITVSCEPTLLMRWLIPRLPQFQVQHPNIAIHLVSGGGPVALGGDIDLAIRRNDFEWPAQYHSSRLFEEYIGPVCRADRVDQFIAAAGDDHPALRPEAIRLHTRTRLEAWTTWLRLSGTPSEQAPGQVFEHFYFSLQAAVAGVGVAIGPWHLVRDDLESGILTAPFGFTADDSAYYLLAPAPIAEGSPQALFREWLLIMAQ